MIGKRAEGSAEIASGRSCSGRQEGRPHFLYILLIGIFFAGAALLYAVCGEDGAYIQVQDNLDLFTAQYRMLGNTGTWFSHNVAAPFLGGVSRDTLPSEWNLVSFLYMILPDYAAYVVSYLLKIVIAMASFGLLAGEILRIRAGGPCSPDSHRSGEPGVQLFKGEGAQSAEMSAKAAAGSLSRTQKDVVLVCGFAYGILNLFPAFGISFASIPLCIWLLLRLDGAGRNRSTEPGTDGKESRRTQKRSVFRDTVPYLIGLFLYPLVSYFSYFGLFLLGYTLIAFFVVWIVRKRFPFRILLGIVVLSLGFVTFEYRLFGIMLFTEEESIRSSLVIESLGSFPSVFLDAFVNGMMHCDGVQRYLVLPVCTAYFIFLNVRYLVRRQWKCIFTDLYNLCALLLVFNAAVYALYYVDSFRNAVGSLIPQLVGWQFNRTLFFSPFLWYASFAIFLVRLAGRRHRIPVHILLVLSVLIIIAAPSKYNDLRETVRLNAYEWITGRKPDNLSYGEFYSAELFEKIKKDLNYQEGNFRDYHPGKEDTQGSENVIEGTGADWAAAYGLHPAVLEYSGIATVDGYLGFYAQSYKESFRKVIAPALDKQPATADFYDESGGRAYLYSGEVPTIVEAARNYLHSPGTIDIDTDALRCLGCRYIFSRIEITNAADKELTLRGIYTDEHSPYTIYVYEL